MPIYEYYCRTCDGRFSHLARRINVSAPPCPRCGGDRVERLISAGYLVRSEAHHTRTLREDVSRVDRTDAQAAARALKASGRLEGATGLYGSKAYRELIERRIEGADDADLDDLVDDLVSEAAATEATQMATAVALSDAVDNRLSAEGPPEDDAAADRGPTSRIEEGDGVARSPRRAPHLGWG